MSNGVSRYDYRGGGSRAIGNTIPGTTIRVGDLVYHRTNRTFIGFVGQYRPTTRAGQQGYVLDVVVSGTLDHGTFGSAHESMWVKLSAAEEAAYRLTGALP